MEREHQRTQALDLDDDVERERERQLWPGKRPAAVLRKDATAADPRAAWHLLARAMEAGGAPLPDGLRTRLERALGADLSSVRVHDDAAAATAAAGFAARAFTVGQRIFLGAGAAGEELMAHEVAHTVQQAGVGAIDPAGLEVSHPDDAHEQAADQFAAGFVQQREHPAPLAPMRGARGSVSRAVIQRLAAGDLKTAVYLPDAVPDGGGDFMRAGCRMDLEFTPGNAVDATEIGFIQTVVAEKKGKKRATTAGSPDETKTQQDRQVPAKEDPGGTAVDRSADKNSPVYGQNNDGKMNTSGGGSADNVLGKRAMNEAGTIETINAKMVDWPHFMDVGSDSCQKFETAVLALKGAQAGTYYGTITWGWEVDSSGSFRLMPATPKDGNPSPLFQRAAQIWNQASSVNGARNLQIPVPMEAQANQLATPALITRYESEGDPIVKAIFRVVLARRTFTVDVTPEASSVLSTDLFIKVTGAQTYRSPSFKTKGTSIPFLVTFGQVMGDANVGTLQVNVLDENTLRPDSQLASASFGPPYAPVNVAGKTTVSIKLGG